MSDTRKPEAAPARRVFVVADARTLRELFSSPSLAAADAYAREVLGCDYEVDDGLYEDAAGRRVVVFSPIR